MKRGTLCAGRFEPGNATYWEVRREGKPCGAGTGVRVWLVYRTSIAEVLIGEYDTADAAYAEFFKHVPGWDNLESSMGG